MSYIAQGTGTLVVKDENTEEIESILSDFFYVYKTKREIGSTTLYLNFCEASYRDDELMECIENLEPKEFECKFFGEDGYMWQLSYSPEEGWNDRPGFPIYDGQKVYAIVSNGKPIAVFNKITKETLACARNNFASIVACDFHF